jgi:acyl-CoA synthetase (AMP-forming)/AMP-acid ligase II
VNLATILAMAAEGFGDRAAIGSRRSGQVTYSGLLDRVRAASGAIDPSVPAVVFVGTGGTTFAVALFASAYAGVPFVPLNYRLGAERLGELLARHPGALVVAGAGSAPALERLDGDLESAEAFAGGSYGGARGMDAGPVDEPTRPLLILYTSGTTAEPKGAVLRHDHLTSYLLGTVEFGNAGADEAALVSVPTYHIAGVANLVSNVYSGRRIVYLPSFTPEAWLDTVREEQITQAMVVPTMLARIVESLAETPGPPTAEAAVPSLRRLVYGGAPMPAPVIEAALRLFPATEFVNAYGLTETSSTIAVLGPADHRAAMESTEPRVRERLRSAGRVLPGVEVEIRSTDVASTVGAAEDATASPARRGEIWVRGGQISGEYVGAPAALDGGGWFPTRDVGYLDGDGYLFVEGRSDDTIIRGGENIAPAEIEAVLQRHPDVVDAGVVGVPDVEWGEEIAAAVVIRAGRTVDISQLRLFVRAQLRGSKTPRTIVVVDSLPRTDTGKLLRRSLVAELATSVPSEPVDAAAAEMTKNQTT